MTRKRRAYTGEFKQEAVKLITDQGYTVAEAAGSLGVHATVLRKWKQKLEAESSAGKNGSLNGEEREELRRLRAENGRLRMEREILKKAAIFFVNEKS
jgi:transposase